MISVEEALKIVLKNIGDWGIEEISLDQSLGRILREKVMADRDFPPYDRVTMDGIGISYKQFEGGQRVFEVAGVAAAGSVKNTLFNQSTCLEVMTGSILPAGVDTVIRYEDLKIDSGKATVLLDQINFNQNIHFKGMDRKQGTEILQPGKRLSSSEIGVCATVGKERIKVSRLPKTIIISTGDELVEIDQIPLPHQIRRSNVYRIATVLKSYHIQPTTAHLADQYDEIVGKLRGYLENFDLIILSGGVSEGKFDYLPAAFAALGIDKLFHKVKQRPGKPFWLGSKARSMIFAFPGNPVSSFMCAQQYFKPWLDNSLRAEEVNLPFAVLAEDVHFAPNLTYFLEVKIDFDPSGRIMAYPIKGNGSGDLANLVDADAFIQLPSDRTRFLKGDVYPFITYRNLLGG